ncbi:hypothetical protein F511_36745 [Dorcoceras hygrometricum]|uniref:Uncharacterized protein n=1 Tax=Dorcoceras hygrometricum TaxID=472368 RepID=A0A2Z7A5Y9_9LAMI|nr:hypothetical protein F511_36745 [Dorcoceras hygrometricum]
MANFGVIFRNPISLLHNPSKGCGKAHAFALSSSQFFSSNSVLKVKEQILTSAIRIKRLKDPKFHASPIVYAAQSNFLKVIQTVLKVGKDGIEAGTDMVPESIPRPIARISVTVVMAAVTLFLLKSFLSTAFFVLAMMGLSYFIFIALNKDEGPKGGGGTTSVDTSLEEARRIMEKYK